MNRPSPKLLRALVGAFAWACGTAPGVVAPDDDHECMTEAPMLEPGPALVPAPSRIVLSAVVDRQSVATEMQRQIPELVASSRGMSIGAPGLLSYAVRRGVPRIDADGEDVTVLLPLSASIQVCKPLFGVCPVYGRCNAGVEVQVRASTRVTQDWQVQEPVIEARVTRGCVLEPIGLNVTNELSRTIQRELAGQRRELVTRTQRLNRELRGMTTERLHALTREPLFEPPHRSCLRVDRIVPLRLSADNTTLSVGLELQGAVAPSDAPCTADTAELGAEAEDTQGPLSSIAVDREISLEAWRDAMNRALGSANSRSKRTAEYRIVGVDAGLRGDTPHVRLQLEGGPCGKLVAFAQPKLVLGMLRVGSVTSLTAPLPDNVRATLESVRYPVPPLAVGAELAPRLEALASELVGQVGRETRLRPRVEMDWEPPDLGKPSVHGRSLWVHASVSARLQIRIE